MAEHPTVRHVEPLSYDQYRALFDAIDDAITVVEPIFDSAGRCVDFVWGPSNPAVFRMTGLRDVEGKRAFEIVTYIEPEWLERYGRVAQTGEPERFEYPVESLGRWLSAFVSRVGGDESRRIVVVYSDITARKRAEAALRESEERQAFLLKLSDALRPLTEPGEIERQATRLLGEHLKADRCFLSPVYEDGSGMCVREEYLREGASSVLGDYTFAQFGDFVGPELQAGRILAVDDVSALAGLAAAERASYATVGIGAYLLVPLVRDGRLAAFLTINHRMPRAWSDADKAIARQAADRLWTALERARTEAALRENEARLAAAFESVPVGAAVVDLSGAAVISNTQYRRFLPNGVVPSRDPARGARWRAWDRDGRPLQQRDFPAARGMQGESVVPGQEMLYTDDDGREIWTSVATVPTRDTQGRVTGLVTAISDIDAAKRSAEALRESEARQTFLLKLTDELRSLSDPEAIRSAGVRIMAEHLDVNRAVYVDLTKPQRDDTMEVAHIYEKDITPWIGDMSVADYGAALGASFTAGQTAVVTDSETEPRFADAIDNYRKFQIRAAIAVPIVKRGQLVGVMGVHQAEPRDWTPRDVNLVEDVADRTWEAVNRAQAEAALRESEERFAQFAKASSAGIWIRDAETLAMEYVSPAVSAIYGVEPETFLGDMSRWAAMIVPEDRDIALEHIAQARRGESVVHEFRIQRPRDGTFRWIRNTDFPLGQNGHVQRIGGLAEDVTEEKLAVEHQGVLLAELQHRVRNIMAVIRAVTARTGERAGSVPEYADLMAGRLLALARVQALLTRAANVSVDIATLVHDEVSAQAHHEGQYVLDGPDVALSPKAAEVLTLAIHELATNALKYGALSTPKGRVTVTWTTVDKRGTPWLVFDWSEDGAPERPPPGSDAPRRRGFGSELIEGRVPYELKGRGTVTIEPGGARCHLEFPLRDAPSILETGAPQRAIVFGGALDMTGEPDLGGHRILVVEDDYFLASDAARALQGAGAEVMGPCSTEEDARSEMEDRLPDAVVLDLNLGSGPSFKLAQTLTDRGIPFLFTTGYDPEVIPAKFDGVQRLQKPVELRRIVGAVANLVAA